MHKRRVAVVYVHPLFGEGIARLLQADHQLQVTCIRAGPVDASEQLKRLRPDVIVMEVDEESFVLRNLVRDLPPALFIGLHFEDNLMDIYRSRQVVAACPETLVEVIHHGLRRRRQPSQQAG